MTCLLYTDYVIWTGYEGLEYELPCYVKYDNLDEINLELYRSLYALIFFFLLKIVASTDPGVV